jgi:hypothetical protein
LVLYIIPEQEVFFLSKTSSIILSLALLLSSFSIFLANPDVSLAAPHFQIPFPCGQTWVGETRINHNPKLSIDFRRINASGDTIVASSSGKIKKIGNLGNKSYGKFVYIDHGNGWETRYAHLSKITVKKGQIVNAGQKIGNVGSTGKSTGPHLHFEQKHNGVVKPIYFGSIKASYYRAKIYKSLNGCSTIHYTGFIKINSGKLPVYEKPTASSKVVQSLTNKSKVTIYCQVNGQKVTGPYGTSKWWNQIGKGKYVPDSFVYTGSDDQIAPTCK